MGLPPSIVGQSQQVIGDAMATGGRGSQTFTTDYSPLSNAFMKKAQLDMNIADLHSNNTNQRASLMAGLDVDKANIQMQGANLQFQKDMYDDQIRREEKANKMSSFEQITGVLAGAASGAAGGAAFGPKGAMIGGVLGGVTALSAGKDRRKQASTLTNIGMISNATSTIKGTLDKKAGTDAMGTRMDDIASASAILRSAAPGSEEHTAAQNNLDTAIGGFGKAATQAGTPLHQVVASQAEMKKMAMNGYDPTDVKQNNTRKFEQRLMEAQGDDRITNPKNPGHKAAMEGLKGDLGTYYQMANGGEVKKSMVKNWLNSMDVEDANGNRRAIGTEHYNSPTPAGGGSNSGSNVRSDSGIDSIRTEPNNPRTGNVTATAGADRSGAPVARQQGSIGDSFGVMANQGSASATQPWGVSMDNTEALQADIGKRSQQMAADPNIAAKATGQDVKAQEADDDDNDTIIPLRSHEGDRENKPSRKETIGKELMKVPFSSKAQGKEEFNEHVKELTAEHKTIKKELGAELPKLKTSSDPAKQELAGEAEVMLQEVDEEIDMIKTGKVKTFNNQFASTGRSIRKDGIGGKLGSMVGLEVGKDSTIGTDDREAGKWDKIEQLDKKHSRIIGKWHNKGSLGESDVKDFQGNNASPGKTKTQVIQGLLAKKSLILSAIKAKTGSTAGEGLAERAKLDEHESKLRMTQRVQLDTYRRKENMKDEAKFLDEDI